MQQEESQAVTYATYLDYKLIAEEFEFQLPLELPEEIINRITSKIKDLASANVRYGEMVSILRLVLDKDYGTYWHVFCGKNFGAYTVHDRYQFAFFKFRTVSFLIYKTTY